MAKDLPYLSSYKNVGELFSRINKAKVPDAFTVRFLADTIGLKSTSDRQLITLLKKLGFLDNTGKPTPQYNLLKNSNSMGRAIAAGVRQAYAPLYEADENSHGLSNDELKGLIAQVSGAEEGIARLINGTFNALVKLADFSDSDEEEETDTENPEREQEQPQSATKREGAEKQPKTPFNPDFRFNIEIHLPSNGTEETYLAIFTALRKALG
jgi:hypothetical protein